MYKSEGKGWASQHTLLFHNTSFSSEGRLDIFQEYSSISHVISLPLLGSEDRPEVLGVLSEVCQEFSPSNSEDGAVYPGAVSQLHGCPDHRSPYVASREVLPILRGHGALLGVTAVCPELPMLLLLWDAVLGTSSISDPHSQCLTHSSTRSNVCFLKMPFLWAVKSLSASEP